jgi:hypothetical protein
MTLRRAIASRRKGIRVVERKTGRMLLVVKQEPDSCALAVVQSEIPVLVQRELAPETINARQHYPFLPTVPI